MIIPVEEFDDCESGAILLLIGDVPELDENIDEDNQIFDFIYIINSYGILTLYSLQTFSNRKLF